MFVCVRVVAVVVAAAAVVGIQVCFGLSRYPCSPFMVW
jgi:hypothetical protein